MLDVLLLGVVVAAAAFMFYEFWRLRSPSSGLSQGHAGLLPDPKGFQNLYTGMSDIELKVRIDSLEGLVSDFERRLEKQEKVMSKLINELSG